VCTEGTYSLASSGFCSTVSAGMAVAMTGELRTGEVECDAGWYVLPRGS
jgi:hypothetical protein